MVCVDCIQYSVPIVEVSEDPSMSEQMNIGIVGGSIAGLAAASPLIESGHMVEVFERSNSNLKDRGTGVAMDPAIIKLIDDGIGEPIHSCQVFDREGKVAWERALQKRVTSWASVYNALAKRVPPSIVHPGADVVDAGTEGDHAWIGFENGKRRTFDLVIGADGIGSVIRPLVSPGFHARYLGYVAYRGLLPVESVPADAGAMLETLGQSKMVNFYLDGSHLVAYRVASDAGQQFVNWMWYRNVPEAELPSVLTDRAGRTHEWSVPAGRVRPELEELISAEAGQEMNGGMASIVQATGELSIQAIFTGNASTFHSGRMVLIGDAARIAIPHIGAGTSMAIRDAMDLAESIRNADEDLGDCLEGWAMKRRTLTIESIQFGCELGHDLQFSNRDWQAWSTDDFDKWWGDLVGDRNLYFQPKSN